MFFVIKNLARFAVHQCREIVSVFARFIEQNVKVPRVRIRFHAPENWVLGLLRVLIDVGQHSVFWAAAVVTAKLVLPHAT